MSNPEPPINPDINAPGEPETAESMVPQTVVKRDAKGHPLPGQAGLNRVHKYPGRGPGRKKGRDLDSLLAEICDEPVDGKFMTRGEALARLLSDIPHLDKAGWTARLKAIELIYDRIEGKPTQRVETAQAPNLEVVWDEEEPDETQATEAGDAGGNG